MSYKKILIEKIIKSDVDDQLKIGACEFLDSCAIDSKLKDVTIEVDDDCFNINLPNGNVNLREHYLDYTINGKSKKNILMTEETLKKIWRMIK